MLKFKAGISIELQEYLDKEYREYVEKTPMTPKERRAVLAWVKEGNSVYDNGCYACYENGRPMEYLAVYRDDEYIREHTKGMDSEEARRYAMAYYGWEDECNDKCVSYDIDSSDELPFMI